MKFIIQRAPSIKLIDPEGNKVELWQPPAGQ